MTQVFISYARKDINFVKRLANDLKQAGFDVWFDVSGISGGERWMDEIEGAIRSSEFVIVVLSPESMDSDWVDREFLFASKLKLKIIPLYYRECDLSINYINLNYIDVQGENYRENFSQILVALNQPAGSPEKEKIEKPPLAPPLGRRFTGLAIFGLGFVIIAMVVGYNLWPDQPLTPTPVRATTFATAMPAVTDTPSSSTATIPPETPTSTQTATHTPTPTDIAILPVPLAQDWKQGCISTLWLPYPSHVPVTERGDGCWNLPINNMFALEEGGLKLSNAHRNAPSEIYGLFAPLPEQAKVTLMVELNELTNADLWVGVFSAPDVNSKGLLMTIPAGRVNKRPFEQRNPFGYASIEVTDLIEQGNGYWISFDVRKESVTSMVNPSALTEFSTSLPSAPKWLFLGYKGLSGTYELDGRFFNFKVEEIP